MRLLLILMIFAGTVYAEDMTKDSYFELIDDKSLNDDINLTIKDGKFKLFVRNYVSEDNKVIQTTHIIHEGTIKHVEGNDYIVMITNATRKTFKSKYEKKKTEFMEYIITTYELKEELIKEESDANILNVLVLSFVKHKAVIDLLDGTTLEFIHLSKP